MEDRDLPPPTTRRLAPPPGGGSGMDRQQGQGSGSGPVSGSGSRSGSDHPLSPSHPSHPRLFRATSSGSLHPGLPPSSSSPSLSPGPSHSSRGRGHSEGEASRSGAGLGLGSGVSQTQTRRTTKSPLGDGQGGAASSSSGNFSALGLDSALGPTSSTSTLISRGARRSSASTSDSVADLLGGPPSGSTLTSSGTIKARPRNVNRAVGINRPQIRVRRTSSASHKGRVRREERGPGLERFNDEEMGVLEMRYEDMSREEIQAVLDAWSESGQRAREGSRAPVGTESADADREGYDGEDSETSVVTPKAVRQRTKLDLDLTAATTTIPQGNIIGVRGHVASGSSDLSEIPISSSLPTPPLFPPSPPTSPTHLPRHPLQILSLAVRELRDTVVQLELENESLKAQLLSRSSHTKNVMSIHDDISEALGTSLTSPTPLKPIQSHPVPSSSSEFGSIAGPHPGPLGQVGSKSPTPTSHSLPPPAFSRSSSTSMTSPDPGTGNGVAGDTRKSSRSIWNANLWGWTGGGGKKPRDGAIPQPRNTLQKRKGSFSSVSSNLTGRLSATDSKVEVSTHATQEEDEHAWRSGDGGNTPSFTAVFLATRILTPDPSSILVSSQIPSNSLIAYLAHSLVSHAQDEGITARDANAIQRHLSRTSRSRSRAGSIVSQDSHGPRSTDESVSRDITAGKVGGTSTGYAYGYGDQALAVGKSLLSSVSNATLRGTRVASIVSDDQATPTKPMPTSTSSKTFAAPALPQVSSGRGRGRSGSSATSPQEEAPPPSVELASIIPDEVRPPTLLLSRQNLGSFFQSTQTGIPKISLASRFKSSEPPLTDRYGFIYDIQHARLLKDASAAGAAGPASLNGTMPVAETASAEADRDAATEGWVERRLSTRKQQSAAAAEESEQSGRSEQPPSRSSIKTPLRTGSALSTGSSTPGSETPNSVKDKTATGNSTTVTRHRSSTILSLNPSPAKPSLAKDHLTVSARGSSSLGVTPDPSSSLTHGTSPTHLPASPSPSASATPSTSKSTRHLPSGTKPPSAPAGTRGSSRNGGGDGSISRSTISSLLDQLTEIHDRQQKERLAEWDVFLKHRAKAKINALEGKRDKNEDMQWGSGLVGIDQLSSGRDKSGGEDRKTFFKLVRRGIPLVYRNDIWAECSGARDLEVPGEYTEILKIHAEDASPVQREIDKDITRTFPSNLFFGGDGPGVQKLKNVLIAYSWHNPAVGYCQGMNMLAATLLLTHPDEEQAYWTLTAIIDRLLPPSFFSPDLQASRVDQLVLDDLVEQYAPKIHGKLVELGVDLASVTFGWFLSLFTDCLPVETLFRVWDVFFVEGHDVLFRVALAILKLNETDIVAAESISDLFTLITGMTSRLWAADKLIALQHSYKSVITHPDINTKFDKHLGELQGATASP